MGGKQRSVIDKYRVFQVDCTEVVFNIKDKHNIKNAVYNFFSKIGIYT